MPLNSYGELLARSPADVAEVLMNRVLEAVEASTASEPIIDHHLFAGDLVWDECCGVLAATWTRIFSTQTFPQPVTNLTICDNTLLAVDVAVILLRCSPVMDDNGNPPTTAEIQASAASIGEEAALIYNTLTGGLPEGWERAGVEQTIQNEGGCVAIVTRLTIGLPQQDWCS
ncbi:hypothetical protein [Ilumatobacter sp.]|uniref:hypothetical protein n=1 Tax=Ilumatobacter sp. TaxID=1967498 RepID=UPI0037526738